MSVLTIVFCSLPVILQSQERMRYTGEYRLGQYTGEASFVFKLETNDTIFDGPFQMQRTDLTELLAAEDFSFSFEGEFTDDIPTGDWKFHFGAFQSERESQLVDYQYRVSVKGIQQEAFGTLQKGKPHGLWTYAVDSIVKSEIIKTLFKSTIEFEEGVPQKSFRIENEEYSLVGRCLRNGLAHDQWSVFSKDGEGEEENWLFDNGLLKKIERKSDEQYISTDIYQNAIGYSKTVNLDDQYVRILEIKQALAGTTEQSVLYEVLDENAEYYKKIDDILSSLGESDFIPAFKVHTEYFPLTESESSQLDSIQSRIGEAKYISESLLNNTQLNIVRLSDDEASFLYEAVREISRVIVQPTEKLLGLREEQVLEAVTRDELLTYLWPDGMPSTTIDTGQGNKALSARAYQGPDARDLDFSPRNLGSVDLMSDYARQSLIAIQQVLGGKLNIERRQQELVQIEDELININKRINKKVDSLKQLTSGKVREALENIKVTTNDKLSAYSALDDKDEKLKYGTQLLSCFNSMERLIGLAGHLPAQWEEIQTVYLDAIWNPHMAVIMEEQTKKRITAAYHKIVIPYVLEEIKTNLNCENCSTYTRLLENLYRRMLELRDEESSKLERKLRKEQDPKEILQLFEVEPIYTD